MLKPSALCAVAFLALAGAARPAVAADNNQVIEAVGPADVRVDGQQGAPEIRKDPAVQGGKALRVHVAAKGANPWDISVGVPVVKPIKAGHRLLLAFYAKVVEGPDGAATVTLPFNAVQLAAAPYTPLLSGPVDIGKDWPAQPYSVIGVADRDYKAGEVGITFQVATAKQVLDFGPVFLIDLGPAQ
jgi:hypothetical protein